MLLFHILAAVWDRPADGREILRAVQTQSGKPSLPADAVEHHVELLRQCGYLRADAASSAPTYTLTAEGSALLARMADAVDRTEYQTA